MQVPKRSHNRHRMQTAFQRSRVRRAARGKGKGLTKTRQRNPNGLPSRFKTYLSELARWASLQAVAAVSIGLQMGNMLSYFISYMQIVPGVALLTTGLARKDQKTAAAQVERQDARHAVAFSILDKLDQQFKAMGQPGLSADDRNALREAMAGNVKDERVVRAMTRMHQVGNDSRHSPRGAEPAVRRESR